MTKVTPALCIATSVPVPMAMPTSACGQGRGIVHAVAGHGHHPSFGPERPDDAVLVLGQDIGLDVRDPELARDRLGGGAVVAREHDDAQAQRLEIARALPASLP